MSTTSPPSAASDNSFFGHPKGLRTLFMTEVWERMSYYGMRALLILFMTAAATRGGMGLDEKTASAIYGLYTAGVYLLSLPGGWVADRLLGKRRTVFWGGVIITIGHFLVAFPNSATFFSGLVAIVVGTGLLKPNVSAIVGDLYPEGGGRRDAGFSLFYAGINIGAFMGPLICGQLGEKFNWHWGFAAAGVGMLAGVIQYHFGKASLAGAGELAPIDRGEWSRSLRTLLISTAVVVALAASWAFGLIPLSVVQLVEYGTAAILTTAALFFLYVLFFGRLGWLERKHVLGFAILFLFSALFWAGFEQQGSSMNLFADRHTDRHVFGWEMPASWLQAVNPFGIILFAPVFAALWLRLTAKGRNPSSAVKFGFGLILLSLGFFLMIGAGKSAMAGDKSGWWWLAVAYILHAWGELCLSPVGLSTVTKLAPARFVSQFMGLWFVSISLGNLAAGRVAGQITTLPWDRLFFWVFVVTAAGGVLLLVLSPWVKKLTADAE